MNNENGVTTERSQMIVISWIPRLTSSLSCLGSLAIIYMILIDRKHKLAKPKNRLMLSMSIFDILHSAAYAVTTLAYPRESMIYGAIGNGRTCTAQGFFLLLGLAVPMYNASLSLMYTLTIRYRMRPLHFAHNIEPFCHTLSVLVPLVIATLSSIMDDIRWGTMAPVCFISLASPMKWPLVVVVPLCFLVNICSMVLICSHVIAQSNKMKKYSYGVAQNQRRESEKRKTVEQALLYMLAFFVTFVFPSIIFMTKRYHYPLEVLMDICYPLQGFWNFVLYIRKSVSVVKRTKPDKYLLGVIWDVIVYPQIRNTRKRRRCYNYGDLSPIERAMAISDFNNGMEGKAKEECEEMKEEITSEKKAGEFARNQLVIVNDLTKPDVECQPSASSSSKDHTESILPIIELPNEGEDKCETRRFSLVLFPMCLENKGGKNKTETS